MDKTGTSAIQKFLLNNKNILSYNFNLDYCSIAQSEDFAHNNLAFSIFEMNGKDNDDLLEYLSLIKKEIDDLDSGAYIISSECLFKSYTAKNFELFISFLKENFKNIKVIFYVRDQIQWLVSRYKHSIISGNTIEIDKLSQPWFLNYKLHIDKWAEIFGEDAIVLKAYDKKLFYGENIYADFLSIFNIEMSSDFNKPESLVNQSLDRDCIEIKKIINNFYLDVDDKNSYNKYLLNISESEHKSVYSYLDYTLAKKIYYTYSEINNDMFLKYNNNSNLFIKEPCESDFDNYNFIPERKLKIFFEAMEPMRKLEFITSISQIKIKNKKYILDVEKKQRSNFLFTCIIKLRLIIEKILK